MTAKLEVAREDARTPLEGGDPPGRGPSSLEGGDPPGRGPSSLEGGPSGRGPSSVAARLAAAPATAEIRGVFFEIMEIALRDDPRAARLPRHRSYAMYALREYLERVDELAASLGQSAERALVELHRNAASFMLSHPGARLFLGPRDRDPHVLLERLERSRSLMASYGHWHVQGGRGHVTITIRDEYVWIEEVWATIVRSVFPHAGIDRASVTVHLDGPFDGVMEVRW